MASEPGAGPGRPAPDHHDGPAVDHRKLPRRRGQALNEAIFQATLDELAEGGYAKLTMERVAERARASKASLYRRWPTRVELAMEAVYHALPDPASPPDTGTLRGDLLAGLRRTADVLAGPAGEAMRGLLSDVLRDHARTIEVRRHHQGAGRRLMQEITRRAVERGEIDAAAVTPRRLEAGQAMLRSHFLFNGVPIPDEVIVEIVDEILMPAFHAGPARS
ncbi:TetR/AcrR family transcriptional regulator [Sphaerisporangium flaviroseum]|uniref:TetR/AcrR family transcriptional regulator n=1 Tax=Sphaerisporangium flaviroseum TaxID=509199 RepID=A0ABP7HWZ9_9ACTN